MAPYIPPHKKHNKNKNKNKNKFQEPEQWIVSQKETNKKVDTNSKSQFPELVKVEVKKEQEESNKKTIADLFKNNKRVKNKVTNCCSKSLDSFLYATHPFSVVVYSPVRFITERSRLVSKDM